MQPVDGPRAFFEFLHLYDKPVKPSPKERRNGARTSVKSPLDDDDFECEERPRPETHSTIDFARDVMASCNIAIAYLAKGFRDLPRSAPRRRGPRSCHDGGASVCDA